MKSDGKWGYINARGEWAIPPRFDYADAFAADGLARAESDGKWGFINARGEWVIPPQFDHVEAFAAGGLAMAVSGGKCGYINIKGEWVIPPRFGGAGDFAAGGLALANSKDGYGYINTRGEWAIPPQFYHAYDFNANGLALVANEKLSYINARGDFVVPIEPAEIDPAAPHWERREDGRVLTSAQGRPMLYLERVCDTEVAKNTRGEIIWPQKSVSQTCKLDKTFTNSIGLEFMLIPDGSFLSGGRKIIISQPFYLGKYEVTQEQWEAVMGGNPSEFQDSNRPVENVSWNDVQEFIRRLNAKEGHNRYRLPTEMEWERAARGGLDTNFFLKDDPETWEEEYDDGDYELERPEAEDELERHLLAGGEVERLLAEDDSFRDRLAEYAWFRDNSGQATHPVGQRKPNPYGLYDIYGNVWEWVEDWYGDWPESPEITDYRGPGEGSRRMGKGGAFDWGAKFSGPGVRYNIAPEDRGRIGFRLALDAAGGEPQAGAESP